MKPESVTRLMAIVLFTSCLAACSWMPFIGGKDNDVNELPEEVETREQKLYRDEQRCKTYYDVETEERLTGYEVSYRFSGREYQTITDQHPGKKLRVRVGVEPAE